MTYAAARAAAADALHPGTGGLLRTPNNILGIEYCKAILHRHAALTPLALPRLGAAHGGGAGAHAGTPMASASFLRGLPQPDWEPFVPARAAELYGRAAADGLCWTAQDSRPPFWPYCGCRTPRILRRCAA